MKKVFFLFTLLLTAGAGYLASYHLPKRQLPSIQWHDKNYPQGVFHVHSEASHDSNVSIETITEAAHEIGLDFVILTDHNSQQESFTQQDISFLSFAELSTRFGHVIQFGADELLSKDEKNNIEIGPLLNKRNAAAIIAHPTDSKRPWNGRWRDVGGIEIASVSASMRRLAGPAFVQALPALAALPINTSLALAQLYDRDHKALSRWDENPDPTQIGICGVDAHGRIDLSTNLDLWRLQLEIKLPQDPTLAIKSISDAIRQGRFHCVASLFGRKPNFTYEAQIDGAIIATAGDSIKANEIDRLFVRAPRIQFPQDGQQLTMVLLRNGEEVLRQHGRELTYLHPRPGSYRVEIRIPVPNLLMGYRSVPIIYSNKIRVLEP